MRAFAFLSRSLTSFVPAVAKDALEAELKEYETLAFRQKPHRATSGRKQAELGGRMLDLLPALCFRILYLGIELLNASARFCCTSLAQSCCVAEVKRVSRSRAQTAADADALPNLDELPSYAAFAQAMDSLHEWAAPLEQEGAV